MRRWVLALFTVTPLLATTYYVGPGGSDSNPGTSGAPFATIQHAADVVNPGDTVLVEDGTYQTSGCSGAGCDLVQPTRSGTASAYITFQSLNPGGAVLDGQNNLSSEGWEISANYLIIKGFEIKGFDTQGISTYRGGSFIDIVGNNIHDIGRECTNRTDGLNTIYLGGNNTTVEQNQLHDSGRYPNGVNGCTLTDTAAHDHGVYVGGYSGTQTGITIKNNLTWNLVSGWAVQLYGGAVSNIQIVNNTFGGPPNGVQKGQIVLAENITNLLIENNVFYNPNTSALKSFGGTWSGITASHNLTYQGVTSDFSASGLTLSGNLDNTDPKIASASAHDFHLQSGSPAIDAGLTISGVTNDYAGTTRPQGSAYDIGAYEFVGGAPVINSFAASPSGSVTPGTSVTLTWTSTNGVRATLNGASVALSGSQIVNPTATTSYVLVVSNSVAPVTQTVTVNVGALPAISSFTASPSTIALGGSSTLAWATSGATSLSIDQGVGTVTGTSTSVSPTTTKLYTLTATNSFGSVTAQTIVGVSVTALVGAAVVNGHVVIH